MNSNITYKPLTATDKEQYRKIRLECLQKYPQNFGSLYEDEKTSNNLKFDKIITENNGTDFLYGAFDGENLVGICGAIKESRTKTKHTSEISHMYVQTAYSGKGIGSALVQLTIEKIFSNNTVEQIILGVVQSNVQAIKLYQNAGFVQYGLFENYYKFDNKYESLVLMILKRETFEK
jgi:ribosomal protein S18 acetylase RimI-like enzyme